jgi:type II secretory pathway component PulK
MGGAFVTIPGGSRRASVLILVLWTVFFLAALAVAIAAYVNAAINMASYFKIRTQGYYAARTGVEHAVWSVRLDTNDVDTLRDFWSNDASQYERVDCGQGYYTISYTSLTSKGESCVRYGLTDEESRINLNFATTNLLAALFHQKADLDAARAKQLAATVLKFRNRKQDERLTEAQRNEYDNQDKGFQNTFELLLVQGMTPEVFDAVKPHVTVFGSGQVNLNTADADVMCILAEASDVGAEYAWRELAKTIVAFRETAVFATRDRESMWRELVAFRPDIEGARDVFMRLPSLTLRSTCFRGVVTGRTLAGEKVGGTIEFVFDRLTGEKLFWQEN